MTTPDAPAFTHTGELWDICNHILTVGAGLVTPAPTRKLVTIGAPAWDCGEQLSVNISNFRTSTTFPITALRSQGSKAFVPVADIDIVWLTCVLTVDNHGQIPGDAALNAESLRLYTQGQALWLGLLNASLGGTLFPHVNAPSHLWRGMQPAGPAAGLAGWKISLEVVIA